MQLNLRHGFRIGRWALVSGALTLTALASCSNIIGLDSYQVGITDAGPDGNGSGGDQASGATGGDTAMSSGGDGANHGGTANSSGGAGATGGSAGCVPADCDDNVACTEDTCVNGECMHTADDNLCDDDVDCTTNTCDSTDGCVFEPDDSACTGMDLVCPSCDPEDDCIDAWDGTEEELLESPTFDDDNFVWYDATDPEQADFILTHTDELFSYVGIDADTPDWAAWIGGHYSTVYELSQTVSIPPNTGAIELSGVYQIATAETSVEADYCSAELFDESGQVHPFVQYSNFDEISGWTPFNSEVLEEEVPLAGRSLTFALLGSTDVSLNTNCFFDTLSLTAKLCE
jgi:hypothetical protein